MPHATPIAFVVDDVPMTVRAMKAGAVEFLTKPFGEEVLLTAIRRAIGHSQTALCHEAEMRASPLTVNTIPEETLKAFADHGEISEVLTAAGGNCDEVLEAFGRAGIELDKLAEKLQKDGAKAFSDSWDDLMDVVASKRTATQQVS